MRAMMPGCAAVRDMLGMPGECYSNRCRGAFAARQGYLQQAHALATLLLSHSVAHVFWLNAATNLQATQAQASGRPFTRASLQPKSYAQISCLCA